MSDLSGYQVVLAARPDGMARQSDFRLEPFVVPEPGAGEVLLAVQYLSLDPYMRGRMGDRRAYAEPVKIGAVMPGGSISTVLRSNHPDYRPGELVFCYTGWRTHAVVGSALLTKLNPAQTPPTTALGALGMPGFTAYCGLYLFGKPAPGETVVVAAACGPVGSMVGQLAKIAGARAVGIAGGPEKCAYVKEELGFDEAVDHRAPDFRAKLASACANGIDIYSENVGGKVWQAVLPLLNKFARVPISGLISQYDGKQEDDLAGQLSGTMNEILFKSLTLRGFINGDYADAHYADFLRDVSKWIAEGRIRYCEDIVEGIENAPEAFLGLLNGRNFGKLLVRIAH